MFSFNFLELVGFICLHCENQNKQHIVRKLPGCSDKSQKALQCSIPESSLVLQLMSLSFFCCS